MSPPADMLTFDEARQRILAATKPVANVETISLDAALGRILATDIVAPIDVPGAANSAMDGFAMAADTVSADTGATLVGTAHAGHPFTDNVGAGECVRIMTGAWLPTGTDAVVMQEQAQINGQHVALDAAPAPGAHVRPAGDDICRGQRVLAAGSYLRATDIGVLATLGQMSVPVFRRPCIAYFSSGDELQPPERELGPGQLYDSNRPMLAALLAELGFDTLDLGRVPDDPQALEAALERGESADAIVSTGGVSVGDADFVRETLAAKGNVDFWRVAIKPGKPLAFGHLGGTGFFGLPGNPVSAAVTFTQLVRPALARLAGGQPAAAQRHQRQLAETIERKPGRTEFMRGQQLTSDAGQAYVRALGHQGSGVLSSMGIADCFIVLPADSEGAAAGSAVNVEPFAQRLWA
ncbi:molybdopterin molybdotransferase MoeA [Salinisphaera sp. USBA-960]|nr:molybdopterin molybdotransferase MoeA [Salifodinibacter halophilus]NNC26832.1 molybdopterin molybdotransferase MoeA [Salifodinibacter halophilus]